MIGSVSPAMHKYIWKPAWWVFTHKVKSIFGGKYSMYENKICREYRDGKVTKMNWINVVRVIKTALSIMD